MATLTLDLDQIAQNVRTHGFTDPNPNNIHEKLLLVISELIEAHNCLRNHHLPTDLWYTAESGWWCAVHHRTKCTECSTGSHRIVENYPAWDRYELSKPEGFGIEILDAIIRLAHIGHAMNIDLSHCYDQKMAYNKQRPYQHGGRAW